MGSNTTHSVSTDDPVEAADINQFHTALSRDIEPRNENGVPAASAGNIGTQARPFNEGHFSGPVYSRGVELGSGTGGSTIAEALENGVVSGKAASGYPGSCGWLLPAGTSGVKIVASASEPLTLKLDGVSHTITADITGGTAPAALSLSRSLQSYTTPSGGYNADEYNEFSSSTRPRYMLATGGTFRYSSSNSDTIAAANGDVFIFKHGSGASTGYIIAQRDSAASHPQAKLAVREGLNTSTSGFTHPYFDLPSDGAVTLIRTGYVFVDVDAEPKSITISNRIVGSVDVLLPGTAGYAAGDVVYRELDKRWYRFSGTAWQKSTLVYVGLSGWDGAAGCIGVQGVRGETAMNAMLEKRNAILGDELFITGTETGGKIYFSGAHDLEIKTSASLQAQGFEKIDADPVIDIANDGTKANNKLFCCYLNISDGSYFYEEIPPQILYYDRKVIHAHPYKHAIFFGSYAVNNSGGIITRASITGSQANSGDLTESNDDAWWINPLLYFRIEFANAGSNYRYPDIELRQGSGGTASKIFNGVNNTFSNAGAADWYSVSIQPHVLDYYRWEIYSASISARAVVKGWTQAEFAEQLGLR